MFQAQEQMIDLVQNSEFFQAAAALRSLPAKVDRWFGESSFDYTEFRDIRRLVELKEKRGLTISAVLPTLNEAATIGPIVRTARRELMKVFPLIDELLVIDSDSEDETRKIAEDEGARVVIHQQVLPKYGAYQGKGEALWKSLYETSGDLVAWCDTDVREWDPRFLYGTLGPLLNEPRFGYVKAYYQRPIVQGGVLTAGGGGRVTELVARPLINLFFPELSGYIQPLSGEYAGRREILEDIPFFTGYAVEIGHLIDLAESMGIEGLGQVDLADPADDAVAGLRCLAALDAGLGADVVRARDVADVGVDDIAGDGHSLDQGMGVIAQDADFQPAGVGGGVWGGDGWGQGLEKQVLFLTAGLQTVFWQW